MNNLGHFLCIVPLVDSFLVTCFVESSIKKFQKHKKVTSSGLTRTHAHTHTHTHMGQTQWIPIQSWQMTAKTGLESFCSKLIMSSYSSLYFLHTCASTTFWMSMMVTTPGRQLLPVSVTLGILLVLAGLFPDMLLASVSPIAVKPFVMLWNWNAKLSTEAVLKLCKANI